MMKKKSRKISRRNVREEKQTGEKEESFMMDVDEKIDSKEALRRYIRRNFVDKIVSMTNDEKKIESLSSDFERLFNNVNYFHYRFPYFLRYKTNRFIKFLVQ
jgi:cytochrome oxidase Cu insertion factor (SCO1/SenC/PrrC family)